MRSRRHREVPECLSRLEQQFAAWRNRRGKGARIPEFLWNSAVASGTEVGLSQTATGIKLDYYGLKKRLERQGFKTPRTVAAPPATLVEIPSPVVGPTQECVIELNDGLGASMRVHLKGAEIPDLLALGRSFWRGE